MHSRFLTKVLQGGIGIRAMSSFRPEPYQASKMTDLGTRRIFAAGKAGAEEYDMMRETARSFFENEVIPHHQKWEQEKQISRECWEKAGENGLLCTMMPEEYGGLGGDVMHAAIVWEEQGYSLCTGPGFALHSEIVAPYINSYGTEEQKQRFLPGMCRGEKIGAIAMTEPGAGSDLQGMRTVATKNADGDYVLNGSKIYITNGAMANVTIVCAKTDPKAGAKGISLFLVEDGLPGFEQGNKLNKVGMHAQDTAELFFNDVVVKKENLLGEEGKGFVYLMQELPQERLLIAAMAQASAEAAFEYTRQYLKDRSAFGKPLLKQQLLRHRMANMKKDLANSRAFVDSCLELHDQGKLDTATASMVKASATEVQGKVADEAVQLLGGMGFMMESPIGRHFVDARVQRIYGGTNEIMMELVSRTIDD